MTCTVYIYSHVYSCKLCNPYPAGSCHWSIRTDDAETMLIINVLLLLLPFHKDWTNNFGTPVFTSQMHRARGSHAKQTRAEAEPKADRQQIGCVRSGAGKRACVYVHYSRMQSKLEYHVFTEQAGRPPAGEITNSHKLIRPNRKQQGSWRLLGAHAGILEVPARRPRLLRCQIYGKINAKNLGVFQSYASCHRSVS